MGEWRYSSTHSLTSALDGGEWSASRPSRFTPRERAPCTHWIGDWVGPRAVLEAVVKRKIPSPRRESNPTTPIVQPAAQRYTDWAITAILDEGGKGKCKVFPVPWRRIGGVGYSSTHSLTSALNGGEWSASRPSRFTPLERAPVTHCRGGWVGPRAGVHGVAKRRLSHPPPGNHTPVAQPVT
jgi:hypothetical protein